MVDERLEQYFQQHAEQAISFYLMGKGIKVEGGNEFAGKLPGKRQMINYLTKNYGMSREQAKELIDSAMCRMMLAMFKHVDELVYARQVGQSEGRYRHGTERCGVNTEMHTDGA